MRVLVAEDSEIYIELLNPLLESWGYQTTTTGDGLEALEILTSKDAPGIALLDWMLPGMDGIDVCRKVRQHPDAPYTYVILLTAKNDPEDIVAGLEAGADDYVVKPYDESELRVRLRAGKRIIELQDQLICAREDLRYQATHDPLTTVWNRGAVMDGLYRELARAKRGAKPVSVVICDLDHFKLINDSFGHPMGDTVLKQVASCLLGNARAYDMVGRYGGEEFILILPDTSQEMALAMAERMRVKIEGLAAELSGGPEAVTASFGVATRNVESEYSAVEGLAAELIGGADQALYNAKKQGRNRVC